MTRLIAGRAPRAMYFGWYIVAAGFCIQFIAIGIQVYMNGVFLTPMTEDLDWTRTDYTWALTLGQFVAALIGFSIGAYIDRHGGRRLIFIGTTISVVGLLLIAESTELWQWILLRGLVFAAGVALFGNLVVQVTLSKWFVDYRGRAIGLAGVGLSLGGVVLIPPVTAFVDAFGWRAGWRLLALLVALVMPLGYFMRRQPEDYGLHPDGRSEEELRSGAGERAAEDFANSFTRAEAVRTPAFYMVVLVFGIAGAGNVTLLLQVIPFLTDSGFTRGEASLMLAVFSFPTAFTKPVWGYLAERVPVRLLAACGFLLNAGGMALVVVFARLGLLLPTAASFFVIGVGAGGLFPLSEFVWASYFGRRYLGAVRSLGIPLTLVFTAGAPLLTSIYFDVVGDYNGAFAAMGLAWVTSAVLILTVRPPKRPARAASELPGGGTGTLAASKSPGG